MGYIIIWKTHGKTALAMAAFVAWLWSLPLFGILQTALPGADEKMAAFNVAFWLGSALGFLVTLSLRDGPLLGKLTAFAAPTAAVVTWLTTILVWMLPARLFSSWGGFTLGVFILVPAIMGLASAIYFTFWGTTIFYVSQDVRGRYMGMMVAAASIFYAVIVLVLYASPLWALFIAGLFLLMPALLLKELYAFVANSKKEGLPLTLPPPEISYSDLKPWKAFWLPFSLTICSFYILSWATHNVVFPAVQSENILIPLLGQSFYSLVAFFAGYLLDKQQEIEKIALVGLIVLGCTFLLLPIAMPLGALLPLYFLLEGSYGLIDLFLWVALAYFCQLFAKNPRHFYAQGLLLNILFIIAGIFLMPLLNLDIVGEGFFFLSLAAGVILFVGILPAISLRKFRLTSHGTTELFELIDKQIGEMSQEEDFLIDAFTTKEKEVLFLMLAGVRNLEITKRLEFSKNTLKTHIRHIYQKAGVRNRSELLFKFANLKSKPGKVKPHAHKSKVIQE